MQFLKSQNFLNRGQNSGLGSEDVEVRIVIKRQHELSLWYWNYSEY